MNIYGHPLWRELETYLGQPLHKEWCNSFDGKITQARQAFPSDEAFYAQTDVYLYQSIGFFLAAYKRPYYGALFQMIGTDPVTILDYGCGSGQDGCWFLQAGLQVSFTDVPSRSLDFLVWRLRQMHIAAPVYLLGEGVCFPQHDLVWCMDVLEHLPPEAHLDLIQTLEQCGRTVMLTLVDDKKADGKVHYPVEVDALTRDVAQRRHAWWQDYHQQTDGSKVRLLVMGERAGRLRKGSSNGTTVE